MKIVEYIPLHKRLDIIVKMLYLESLESGQDNQFYTNLYLKHIELQSGFREDHKTSADDFLNDFQKLYANIQKNGFDTDHTIELGKNNLPLTGAHRIACCLHLGIDVPHTQKDDESGISWDINWFSKNHFSQKEILSILRKYSEISSDRCIILWPTCKKSNVPHESLRYTLSFEKPFFLEEMILDIYSFDTYNTTDIGIQEKSHILGAYKSVDIVFLSDTYNKDTLRKELVTSVTDTSIHEEKKYFFTFHSGDTTEEDQYIRDIVLSALYFFHLEKRTGKQDKNFLKLLKTLPPFYNRNMCIVGSGPLGVYNLTNVSDIDLISPIPKDTGIQKLSEHVDILDYQYYEKIDNTHIIEKHFFYWRGYKCISLILLGDIKSLGLREKDQKQVRIIHDFLGTEYIGERDIFTKLANTLTYYRIRFLVSIVHIATVITKKLGIYEQVSYYWRKYILTRFR